MTIEEVIAIAKTLRPPHFKLRILHEISYLEKGSQFDIYSIIYGLNGQELTSGRGTSWEEALRDAVWKG